MREFKISVLKTNRTDVFNKYVAEVSNIPLITPEEEVRLARLIREGDSAARDKLVNANLRFVISVAKRYEGIGSLKLVDLISEGNYGLIKAADRFDETKGFKFISYAIWHIRQCIMAAISNSVFIKIPTHQLGLNKKITTSRSALEQELEREPTVEEIASVLDVSTTTQEIISQLNFFNPIWSLDVPIQEEGGTLLELLPDANSSNPAQVFDPPKINEVFSGLHKLSEKERDIINSYYDLTPTSLSRKELANKYNISAASITSFKKIALRKLRIHCKEQGYCGFSINPYRR